MYRKESIDNYLNDAAAKKAAPGGGSAAALTGALGASLLSMAARYTLGKEKHKDVEEKVTRLLGASENVREELTKMVDEDVAVYKRYSDIYKTKDSKEIEQAAKDAAGVPTGICKSSFEGLRIAAELVDIANTNLICDVAVAAELLAGAYISARINIDINLKGIHDEEFIAATRKSLEPMEGNVLQIKDEVMGKVRRVLT